MNDVIYLDDRRPNARPKNSLKDEIAEGIIKGKSKAEGDEDTGKKRKKSRKPDNSDSPGLATPKNVFNVDHNSGNVIGSVAGNVKITSKTTKVTMAPPPDTIGGRGDLVQIINEGINKLAQTRIKDWIKQGKYTGEEAARGPAYQVTEGGLKRHLGIRKKDNRKAITIIKEMNVNRFDEVMEYLRGKYANTATGRIKGSVRKPKSSTPFVELMQVETSLLKKMGLKADSPEVYAALERYYGVGSHKFLETYQHKNWITRLEQIIDEIERGNISQHNISL